MGVTIHFEGQLKSDKEFESVIEKAIEFATINEMPFYHFNEPLKKLERVKDEQDWDYEGPTKGIHIQPDANAEPFWLEFDKDNYIQDYCKTQFAGPDVHIKLIDFLKSIQSNFFDLNVFDEGEYWETNDVILLENNFHNFFDAAENAKKENPKLNGPFKLEDGRIIDLMD